jgi:hypothetical protein
MSAARKQIEKAQHDDGRTQMLLEIRKHIRSVSMKRCSITKDSTNKLLKRRRNFPHLANA